MTEPSENQEVVKKYLPMIYKLAFANVKNKSDAEDISHDVILKYICLSPDFANEEHRKNWFIRVTVNQCKDFHKSAWKKYVFLSDEYNQIKSEYTDKCDDKIVIHDAMMKLPQKFRSIIHLFYNEDMTISQISEILDIKESAVKMRLKRGKEKLKKILQESGEFFDD